jgi:5-methylcytosine-specific restriction endonuclease McrA
LKNHTKIYLAYFGYDTSDVILCEVCGKKSVDVHHIKFKGMGGSKKLDYIENLVALCRECHEKCHASKEYNEMAKQIHLKNLYK